MAKSHCPSALLMFLFQTTLTPRWMRTQLLRIAASLMKGVGGITRCPMMATVSSGSCSVLTGTHQPLFVNQWLSAEEKPNQMTCSGRPPESPEIPWAHSPARNSIHWKLTMLKLSVVHSCPACARTEAWSLTLQIQEENVEHFGTKLSLVECQVDASLGLGVGRSKETSRSWI